jgi:protein-disulfide isomerase
MRWRNAGTLFRCASIVTYLVLNAGRAPAQPVADEIQALRKEVEKLQANQRQLQKDIQLIKSMLLGKQVTPEAPPLQDIVISTAGAASIGAADAKVVLVEFSDYQCPFCGRYANDTFWRIIKQYVDTGKIRYVMRNFPLEEAHPFAEKAAEAAECAAEQGKYWEAHERLFRTQQLLDLQPLVREAASLGMDESSYRDCLGSGKKTQKVKADVADGLKIGVEATPTFYFGYKDDQDPTKVRALKMLTGAQPEISFAQILEYLLDPPKDGGKP